jgi:hypothetical protein
MRGTSQSSDNARPGDSIAGGVAAKKDRRKGSTDTLLSKHNLWWTTAGWAPTGRAREPAAARAELADAQEKKASLEATRAETIADLNAAEARRAFLRTIRLTAARHSSSTAASISCCSAWRKSLYMTISIIGVMAAMPPIQTQTIQ